LRRYSFKKPRREACPSEQVNSISIFDFKEEKQKHNLQQDKKTPLHQEEFAHEQTPEKIHIPNKKCMKIINRQAMAANLHGKKV